MARTGSSNSKGPADARGSASPELPKPRLTVAAILDKLDAADDGRYRNRRAGGGVRERYRRTAVPLRMRHPGGSVGKGVVATRNLSNSGIGFIYNRFLHIGTAVSVTLPRKLGGEDEISGVVVYCQHVAGTFHQIGVRFEQKIFSKLYAEDDRVGKSRTAPAAELVAAIVPPFAGRLFVIDTQPMDRALVRHHLRETAASVECAEDLQQALALITKSSGKPFDATVCEIDAQATGDGIAATLKGLRATGRAGAIIAATPTVADAIVRRALKDAGAIEVITKPYQEKELLSVLAHAVAAANVETAVEAAERGIDEVDAMVKSIDAVRKKSA